MFPLFQKYGVAMLLIYFDGITTQLHLAIACADNEIFLGKMREFPF